MKISKFKFLRILAKHFSLKITKRIPAESEISLMVNAISPMFYMHFASMKAKGIITNNDLIDIEKLEQESDQLFRYIPIINIPMGNANIAITKEDVCKFIEDLYKHGDIDEVIYLPCHN